MKNSTWLFLLLTVLVIACNKDKFTTEPIVDVKSISPGTVSSGDVITLKAKYTDDEGDLDSSYIVYKWYNGTAVVKSDTIRFPADLLNLPPKLREAEMIVNFEYNTNNRPDLMPLPGVSLRDTTASFGLILIDKAGHRSNYSESAKIRLQKP